MVVAATVFATSSATCGIAEDISVPSEGHCVGFDRIFDEGLSARLIDSLLIGECGGFVWSISECEGIRSANIAFEGDFDEASLQEIQNARASVLESSDVATLDDVVRTVSSKGWSVSISTRRAALDCSRLCRDRQQEGCSQ